MLWKVAQGRVGQWAIGTVVSLAELTVIHLGDEAAATARALELEATGWLERIEEEVTPPADALPPEQTPLTDTGKPKGKQTPAPADAQTPAS